MMNETQRRTFEIFLDSACFENDFRPITENALSQRLKNEGLDVSSSTINRWKLKFNWQQAIEDKVRLSMSEDKSTRALIVQSGLEAAVKNTKVDIDRNNVLLAGCYEIAEFEINRIIKEKDEKGAVSKEDFKRFEFLMTTAGGRSDKMLDRLALMPKDAVSAQEVLSRLEAIDVEIEDDAEARNDDS